MGRINPLVRDMEIPLIALTKGASLILLGCKPTYEYINQQRSESVIGYTYTVVDNQKFNKIQVKVESTSPLLTDEQISTAKEHIFVKFEQAIIKLYITQSGDVEFSIKATGISLQK